MSQKNKKYRFINRDLSWLDFNERVLQQVLDDRIPLLSRFRFMGIFSNNLDEFFQVRFSTIQRIADSEKSGKKFLGGITADELLEALNERVIKLESTMPKVISNLLGKFIDNKIKVVSEKNVLPEHKRFLDQYFIDKVLSSLVPVIFTDEKVEKSTDNTSFLAVKLELEKELNGEKVYYSTIEIPNKLNRHIILPKKGDSNYIMIIDDLIRYKFDLIYGSFNYKSIESHMIHISRDSSLELREGMETSYIEKILKSVKGRANGDPVRIIYDKKISKDTLNFIIKKFYIQSNDSIIPGGRYHSIKDMIKMPTLGRADLNYKELPKLPIKGLAIDGLLMPKIKERDYLVFTPYHSFLYIIKFLKEAAIDPYITSIKITLYRVAQLSNIVSSLVNARKNGKKVLVQIELKARFDEANNINYASVLENAGANIVFGIEGLKVHSKICVIERVEGSNKQKFGLISTGNFNENTSELYTDYTLLTANQSILKDVNKVFEFIKVSYKPKKYKELIVSPNYTFNSLSRLIDIEINNAKQNKPALIQMKLNSLSNHDIISKLYDASCQGVKIQLIVRGICCLIPGVKGMSENIQVISIIDRFLEHSRFFIFKNGGDSKVFISSADLMSRNIFHRIEVICPIYQEDIKQEIIDHFDIYWSDNISARWVNRAIKNEMKMKESTAEEDCQAQLKIHEYYKKKLAKSLD